MSTYSLASLSSGGQLSNNGGRPLRRIPDARLDSLTKKPDTATMGTGDASRIAHERNLAISRDETSNRL
ncbi:splicing factor 3b [Moniliophthora roreri]|nr:splicing factor 3b [Moniliophthora roreri]